MPQEFHVLRCYSCSTFQVHQVKKSRKWNCKLCGEKQSVQKVFGQGTGADCRRHVQKLNMMRGEVDEAREVAPPGSDLSETGRSGERTVQTTAVTSQFQISSKWSSYMNDDDDASDEDAVDHTDTVYTTDWQQFDHTSKEWKKTSRNRFKARNSDGHHSKKFTPYSAAQDRRGKSTSLVGQKMNLPGSGSRKFDSTTDPDSSRTDPKWTRFGHTDESDLESPNATGFPKASSGSASPGRSKWSRFQGDAGYVERTGVENLNLHLESEESNLLKSGKELHFPESETPNQVGFFPRFLPPKTNVPDANQPKSSTSKSAKAPENSKWSRFLVSEAEVSGNEDEDEEAGDLPAEFLQTIGEQGASGQEFEPDPLVNTMVSGMEPNFSLEIEDDDLVQSESFYLTE